MLTGAIAAAVTPLADGGGDLDEDAIGPLTRFLAQGGIDGVLSCGTTGEGSCLGARTPSVAERFVQAPRRFQVAITPGPVDVGHGRAGDAREGGRADPWR